MTDKVVRVGVVGAGGRMGATACEAIAADPELELVAAIDPGAAGGVVHGIEIADSPTSLVDAGRKSPSTSPSPPQHVTRCRSSPDRGSTPSSGPPVSIRRTSNSSAPHSTAATA